MFFTKGTDSIYLLRIDEVVPARFNDPGAMGGPKPMTLTNVTLFGSAGDTSATILPMKTLQVTSLTNKEVTTIQFTVTTTVTGSIWYWYLVDEGADTGLLMLSVKITTP